MRKRKPVAPFTPTEARAHAAELDAAIAEGRTDEDFAEDDARCAATLRAYADMVPDVVAKSSKSSKSSCCGHGPYKS